MFILFLSVECVKAQCWKTISSGGYGNNSTIKTDSSLWNWNIYLTHPISDTQHDWVCIAAGWNHNMAIRSNGTLWTWGYNDRGQLGNGTFISNNIDSPVQVGFDSNWKYISAGIEFSLAIKNDGTLWAWGGNNTGQLGNNSYTAQTSPIQIGTDHDWDTIAAGSEYSLGIKTNGTLWGWGADYILFSSVPAQIDTSTNWQSISAGYNNSLVIKKDGTLWGWGYDAGTLGLGSDSLYRLKITRIGNDSNWKSASAGVFHCLALQTNNTLWACGDNTKGALGDSSNLSKSYLTQIGTDSNWQSICAGSQYSHAIKTDGTLWGWGYNRDGQLGDGSYVDKYFPVQIFCPNSPVPVKLLYFNAQLSRTVAQLSWQTSTELNNKEYQIERSNNGITFYRLAAVKSANNPNGSHYTYTDAQPQSGLNYYRLKSVDIDGNCIYSNVRLVLVNRALENFTAYPNPSKNALFVKSNFKGRKLTITFIDNAGRKVLQVEEPNNKQLQISMANLMPGIYQLSISDGLSKESKLIFKE